MLKCKPEIIYLLFHQFDLQEKLKVAEEQIVSSNNGADSGESETVEDLKVELERREKVLRATVEERDTLMSELEELDRQNQEATQVRLVIMSLTLHQTMSFF